MEGDTKETPKEKAGGAKATDIAREVGPIRRAYYQRIRDAKEKGEFTAWSMVNQPDPIFVAFDVVPVLAGEVVAVRRGCSVILPWQVAEGNRHVPSADCTL